MKKWVTIIAFSVAILGLLFYHFFIPNTANVELMNGSPFNVLVSLNYQSHKDSTFTEGHYFLKPGDRITVKKEFTRIKPNLKLYYKTTRNDSELIRWFFNLPHKNFGIRDIRQSASNNLHLTPHKLPIWKSESIRQMKIDSGISFTNPYVDHVNFETLRISNKWWHWKNYSGAYIIRDKDFLIEAEKINHNSEVTSDIANKYAEKAKFLRDSLMFEFEKPGELTLYNTLPVDVFYQYNYQATKDSSVSVGWIPLLSGEENNINVLFRGSKPAFQVSVKTSKKDSELIRWWKGSPPSTSGIINSYYDTLLLGAKDELNRIVRHINDSLCEENTKNLEYSSFGKFKPKFRKSDSTYFQETYIVNKEFDELYDIDNLSNLNNTQVSRQYFSQALLARDTLTKLFIKKGEFEVVNTTPFTVYFVVNFPITKDSVETEGYWKLEAGESQRFERTFYGVNPRINVYAHTSNSETHLVKEAFGLSSSQVGRIYYQSGSYSKGFYYPIKPIRSFKYTTYYNSNQKPEHDSYHVLFASSSGQYLDDDLHYHHDLKNQYVSSSVEFHKGQFLIMERRLPYIYENESFNDHEEAVNTFLGKAKALRSSIQRKVRYDELMAESYQSGHFPYMLGISMNSYFGNNSLGVKVYDKWKFTNLLGGSVPFEEGDVITSFNDTPVFSPQDLYVLLHNHALSLYGGIAKPIDFDVFRDNQMISGQTLYFFNPNFPWIEIPWWKKALWGLADAVTYGFDDDLYQAFTARDPWKGWRYVQDKSRLVQFSDKSYFTGNVAGVFVSPGRFLVQGIVKKQIRKLGMRRGIASMATTVTLEGGEAVIWTFGNKSPIQTQEQFLEEMKQNVFFGVGIGVVAGSFSLKKR